MLQDAQNNYANDFKAAVEEILLRCPYHTESLITLAEICESKGQREGVSDAIRRCVYGLERAWHPLFTPFEGNCRLSCTYVENKQFFRCFLARIKMMDCAGIQKSGFETCKLLLSLHDPTDALLCVDYFALSLGEYTWLERFADEYRGGGNNSLWILPNFAYSLALARFFLERTQTGSSSNSSSLDLMKQAVMLYPTVLMKLQFKTGFVDRFKQRDILKNEPLDDRFKKVPLKDREPLESHPYFLSDRLDIPSLDHLINIYVARNYLIWKNRAARDLLWKAVEENISLLKKNDPDARDWVCVRKAAFPAEHNEYGHLFISDFSDVMSIIPDEDP